MDAICCVTRGSDNPEYRKLIFDLVGARMRKLLYKVYALLQDQYLSTNLGILRCCLLASQAREIGSVGD